MTDPEQKRKKIIGKEFIEVFNEEAKKIPDADFLAQEPCTLTSSNLGRIQPRRSSPTTMLGLNTEARL